MRDRGWAGALGGMVAAGMLGLGLAGSEPQARQETTPPPVTSPEAQAVLDCMQQNRPERTARQHVAFTCVDRFGQRRPTEAELLGKELEDHPRRGLHAVRLLFTAPYDLRGSCFLINEAVGRSNEMFFCPSATCVCKRITARATTGGLGCTDFSYEDFERWQLLNKPGVTRRISDGELDGRPIHRLETDPAAESGSAYRRIVTSVDQETCVVLKTESFEDADEPRKVLLADPKTLLHSGAMWLATELQMRDLLDGTKTEVSITDVDIDEGIKDREFQPSACQRICGK